MTTPQALRHATKENGDCPHWCQACAIEAKQRAAVPAAPVQPPRPSDDALWDQTLGERDNYQEWADKLAEGIASHFGVDIGEHSSVNNPWRVALEVIDERPCTCNPDDSPPSPCAKQYALGDCRAAAPVQPEPPNGPDWLYYKRGWEVEASDLDALLRLLGFDPDVCRTDSGHLMLAKVRDRLAHPSAPVQPEPEQGMGHQARPLRQGALTDAGGQSNVVGYIVFSDDIEHAALYPLSQRDEAFDAARRWKASISALTTLPGSPEIVGPEPGGSS